MWLNKLIGKIAHRYDLTEPYMFIPIKTVEKIALSDVILAILVDRMTYDYHNKQWVIPQAVMDLFTDEFKNDHSEMWNEVMQSCYTPVRDNVYLLTKWIRRI